MDFYSLVEKNNLPNPQALLSCVKTFAQNLTLTLLLFTLLLPVSYAVINTNAQQVQTPDQINPKTRVTVEIIRKGQTQPEVKEMTLEEMQNDRELTSLNNFPPVEQSKLVQLNLTPERTQEIEDKKGIFSENEIAIMNPSV